MSISVEVVLFDLGGTLFYDHPAAWPRIYARAEAALWKALRQGGERSAPEVLFGGPDTLLRYYYRLRGEGTDEPGTYRVLRELLDAHGETIDDALVMKALRGMYAITQRNWRLERDARRTLSVLRRRRFRLGAISNGSDDANASELLRRARLLAFFELVLTSAAHRRRKPEPSIFQAALDHFAIPPERAVMIGDNYAADIMGARRLGIHTIWITRRAAPLPLAQPVMAEATVSSLSPIPALLA